MTDERMNEITQYAQQRLRTGDILASYALEVIDFAHEAVDARHQAGHSAAELIKLVSQTEEERDADRAEADIAKAFHDVAVKERDYERVRANRLEQERDEARAEVERLRDIIKVLKSMDDGKGELWVES